MSAHTTKYITREKALRLILAFLVDADDQDLQEILFELTDPKLLRYQIHPNADQMGDSE